MGSVMSFAGPGEKVVYKYATRVEVDGVVLCPMLSRKGRQKRGSRDSKAKGWQGNIQK